MGTNRKHKSADDDEIQADSLKKGDPGSWMSENGNELQITRPTRAGMSDEVAQEFQVISNGNANIDGPQVNLQNEISDPDEYAKAANVTPPDRSCMGDPTFELDRPQYDVFDRGSTWKQKACALVKQMDHLLQLILFMPVAGQRAFIVDEEAYHRAEHDDSRRWSHHGKRWINTQ